MYIYLWLNTLCTPVYTLHLHTLRPKILHPLIMRPYFASQHFTRSQYFYALLL